MNKINEASTLINTSIGRLNYIAEKDSIFQDTLIRVLENLEKAGDLLAEIQVEEFKKQLQPTVVLSEECNG